ncbi:MAG: response regulator [Nitrospinae bacterium]|nr:response regulator [Nitrospinota bacterium]
MPFDSHEFSNPKPQATPSKPKGLLMDLLTNSENQLKDQLKKLGFEIDHAQGLDSALQAIKHNQYDFILFADKSPDEQSGPGFLDSLCFLAPEIKLIVLADKSGMKKYIQAKRSNVIGYMSININLALLRLLVNEMVKEKHTLFHAKETGYPLPGASPFALSLN